MRLSTSTCMVFNRPDGTKASIPETLKFYAEAGFKVMDMNFHDCAMFKTPMWDDSWTSYLNQIKEESHEFGLEFSQGHSHFYNYCDKNFKDKEWHEEQVRRSILGAEILGIKWLVIHAATDWDSVDSNKKSKEKSIEYFKPLLEFAGKHNIGIAIENLWEINIAPKRRYCSFAEELVDLVDSLDYPNVGICWDFEHSAIMQQNQIQALSYVGNRLKATHISDYINKEYDHVLPFAGISDVDEILKALALINYDGDFTYETFRYTMRLPEELIVPALKYSVTLGQYLVDKCEKYKRGEI